MGIDPKNLTAQFSYRAAGNPPGTLPHQAISNFFPGLEFDLRSLWKHLLEGVELHEAGQLAQGHVVLAVAPGSVAESAGVRPRFRLTNVDGHPVDAPLSTTGTPVGRVAMELFNAFADIVQKAGAEVPCVFIDPSGSRVETTLRVRPVLEGAALSTQLLEPGAMTQGLCSPWQADYRECGCFYWAASRPDFVNSEVDASNMVRGHSWMQTDRSPGATYVEDNPRSVETTQIRYEDLYIRWQEVLKFVVGGKDSE
ncbi:LodA/GoxA family CTQ-dependent oxidase [Ensifer aridi]|uniref:LodA/GoxA family CTQ-dependent oxidase n=1 Tax=Ensifer aridi TaxID=1708715 RepID=UPI000A101F63|nr:hypothetical protein [Ensifer aridi]